jgi:hypothetical protein
MDKLYNDRIAFETRGFILVFHARSYLWSTIPISSRALQRCRISCPNGCFFLIQNVVFLMGPRWHVRNGLCWKWWEGIVCIRAYPHCKIKGGLFNIYDVIYVIQGMLPNNIFCVFKTTLTENKCSTICILWLYHLGTTNEKKWPLVTYVFYLAQIENSITIKIPKYNQHGRTNTTWVEIK